MPLVLLILFSSFCIAQEGPEAISADPGADAPAAAILPVLPATSPQPNGVEWTRLTEGSIRFLAVMHAFRWATEPATRGGGFGLGSGYLNAVSHLHGWADGDPFYVNYVGHPMQGAVAGRLFQYNDSRYRYTEFGRSAEYWKSKLRATAFAAAFSAQFEMGPLSEASIGHIQAKPPEQGFVDFIMTPTLGLGWMVAEDALDRYVVKPLEARTGGSLPMRILLRGALNPAHSFAALLNGSRPWRRDSRLAPVTSVRTPPPDPDRPAPFEFSVASKWNRIDGMDCVGGGAEAAARTADTMSVVFSVSGCKFLEQDGDALIYQAGPRWTPVTEGKWSPYTQVLVGGMKLTVDQTEERSTLAVAAGAGVDYRVSPAIALRLASLEYQRGGLQFTTGMVLRLGTW